MNPLSAYIGFMMRNPVFSLYAIGAKCIIGWAIYDEIREKMRNTGVQLAK